MPVNDPSKNQYQIWIIDPIKYKQPVDGGVFNITDAGRDIIIPINPKLPISNAKGFAITIEQPGGVVVSSQELILTAPEIRPRNTFTL
jgi:anti-sigma-K factor RskA